MSYQNYKYMKPSQEALEMFYPPERVSNFKEYKSPSQIETLDIGRISLHPHAQKNKMKYNKVNNPHLQAMKHELFVETLEKTNNRQNRQVSQKLAGPSPGTSSYSSFLSKKVLPFLTATSPASPAPRGLNRKDTSSTSTNWPS